MKHGTQIPSYLELSIPMTTSPIEPDKLYWASTSAGHALRIPGHCVLAIARSGNNDAAVAAAVPVIRAQMKADNFPNAPTPEHIRQDLADRGAWSPEELSDDDANFARFVWFLAWDIADEENPDCSEPLP